MGVPPFSPIFVTGARKTAMIAALSPPKAPESTLYLDALGSLNAGVTEGSQVICEPFAAPYADKIVVSFPFNVPFPDGRAVSDVLLGKVLTEGDRVSLLPQDYTRMADGSPRPTSTLMDAIAHLRSVLGENWKLIDLGVVRVVPGPSAIVTPATALSYTREIPGAPAGPPAVPRLENLGGIDTQRKLLEEWLRVSFDATSAFARMGLSPPDGVLIYGPPGSGKSSLVAAMAAHLGSGMTVIYGAHLASWNPEQTAAYLRQVLRPIQAPPPQIVLVEDIDRLAPDPRLNGAPSAITPVLIDELRACNARPAVAVVATTNDRSLVDPALIGPGLLENELAIPVPRREDRLAILSIHTRSMPLADDVSLEDIAARTAGFVGADLRLLCQKAAAISVARKPSPGGALPAIRHKDFLAALGQVRPTAADERQLEVSDVRFADVGDLEEVKKALEETILWPLRYPETMRRYKLKSPRGLLLFGPPGCGKTYVMKALANEASASFFAVQGPELLSKWVGESERAVRDLFRRAEAAAPSIVLFDEIDSIAPPRGRDADGSTDRVVGQLLALLDGLDQMGEVWVVGATNRPDMVDPALIRPGRLEKKIYVGPPDEAGRLAVLEAITRNLPLSEDVDLSEIAARTEGFSCADLEAVIRKAMIASVQRRPDDPLLDWTAIAGALQTTQPSITPEVLRSYSRFTAVG